MAKVRIIQCSFAGGELSDTLKGRRDTNLFYNGAEKLTNVIVRPQGGVRVRPGLRHVAEIYQSGNVPALRLLGLVFDVGERYVVCLYNLTAKVIRVSDHVQVAQLTTPWPGAKVAAVDWVQIYDTLLIVHPDYPMQQIVRGPAEAWTIGPYVFESPPLHRYHKDQTTRLNPSDVSGSITVVAEDGDTDNDVFSPNMVGEIWSIGKAAPKRFRITAYTNSTHVTATVLDTLPTAGSDRDWMQQAASADHGYFRSVAYYQDRLWLGGTRDLPFRIWGSRTAAAYDFLAGGDNDDDPLEVPASTGRGDPIQYLVPGSGGLEVYTASSEGYLPSGPDQPITPATIAYFPQTEYGCRRVKPARLDAITIFSQRDAGALREFVYSNVEQAFSAAPLTTRAAHLADDPVSVTTIPGAFGLQADFLCIINRDGTGAFMSSQRQEKVAAWSDFTSAFMLLDAHSVGGRCYVSGRDGAGRHHLFWLDQTALLDGQKDGTGTDQILWTNFASHLANRDAELIADGYWRGSISVGGSGTLHTDPYDSITVGYDIPIRVKPMPPELEGEALLGRPIRPVRAVALLRYSAGVRINGRVVPDRPFDNVDVTPPQALNRVVRMQLSGWRKDGGGAVEVTREGPFPFELIELAVEYGIGG